MQPLIVRTAAEQVADHIRSQIVKGDLTGYMPGSAKLASDLEVGRMTMEAALRKLEDEGILLSRGRGRQRRVCDDFLASIRPTGKRIGLLTYEPEDMVAPYSVEIRRSLESAGHLLVPAPKSLSEIDYKLERAKRLVKKTPADCWIVYAGSQELLGWLSKHSFPAFALFGRRGQCAIAGTGPDVIPPTRSMVRRLVELGHRRVVMIVREERINPCPGRHEAAFLEELEAVGLATGPYNLPRWKCTAGAFRELLRSLFAATPPTALLFQEPELYLASIPILASLGKQNPRDVSLFCTTSSPFFKWQSPTVSHIEWDYRSATRRIIQWVENIAKGREDIRQHLTKAWIVDGGSIGPAPTDRTLQQT